MRLTVILFFSLLLFSCQKKTLSPCSNENLSVIDVGDFHQYLAFQLATTYDINYCGILGYSFASEGMMSSGGYNAWEVTEHYSDNSSELPIVLFSIVLNNVTTKKDNTKNEKWNEFEVFYAKRYWYFEILDLPSPEDKIFQSLRKIFTYKLD